MRLVLTSVILAVFGFVAVPPSGIADDASKTPPAKTPPAKPSATSTPEAGKQPTAKQAPAKQAPARPAAAKPAPPPLTAEREAEALAFAREHHPELATLIEKLRKDNRRQFDRALRQLVADRDRLVQLKKRVPAQYDLALAVWKLDSRAHLLAARMTMSQDPALEAELKNVLRDRVDVRLKQLQFERDRANARLKQLETERGRLQDRLTVVNKTIDKMQADKNAVADGELLRIKQSIAKNRRPAAKRPAPNDGSAKPVVAERPRVPADKSAASVTAPADSSNTRNKSKQD
jgi:hypothetical protein